MMASTPTVEFFVTCLVDPFSPDVGEAAVKVLRDAGCSVGFDERQTCCGQPALTLGDPETAGEAALRTMALYEPGESPIVVPSGSCAAMMAHEYPRLFAAGTPERARAEAFAARVHEWSAFLVHELGYRPPATDHPTVVTLHPSCHALRGLGVRDEPRQLLAAAGHGIVTLPREDACCGFGGAFSTLMPEMSGAILQDKLACVREAAAAGAKTCASLDAGCLLHMAGAARRQSGLPHFAHVAELLAAAIDRRRADASPS